MREVADSRTRGGGSLTVRCPGYEMVCGERIRAMSAELEVFEAYIEAASCAKSTKLFRNAGEVVERVNSVQVLRMLPIFEVDLTKYLALEFIRQASEGERHLNKGNLLVSRGREQRGRRGDVGRSTHRIH